MRAIAKRRTRAVSLRSVSKGRSWAVAAELRSVVAGSVQPLRARAIPAKRRALRRASPRSCAPRCVARHGTPLYVHPLALRWATFAVVMSALPKPLLDDRFGVGSIFSFRD